MASAAGTNRGFLNAACQQTALAPRCSTCIGPTTIRRQPPPPDPPVELASFQLSPVGRSPPPQIGLFQSEGARGSPICGQLASWNVAESFRPDRHNTSTPAAARPPRLLHLPSSTSPRPSASLPPPEDPIERALHPNPPRLSTCVEIIVAETSWCPSSSWIVRMSYPPSSKCVAKLCLLCGAPHKRHYAECRFMPSCSSELQDPAGTGQRRRFAYPA